MSGGLVQITNYGSHDIMLTNNPEITFFKVFYRHYSNFGKIFIENKFDNPINFGTTSVLNIPKAYDLLSNLILKIKLPTFNNFFEKKLIEISDLYITYYKYFTSFSNQLINIIDNFFNNIDTSSISYIDDLNIFITDNMTQNQFTMYYELIDFYFGDLKNIEYYKNACLYKNLIYIYENATYEDYNLYLFKNLIYSNVNILLELNKILYEILLKQLDYQKKIEIKWIDKISIYLFDYFEIYIGSNLIVKLTPNYVDMYGQLTYQNELVYNKMINDDDNIYANDRYVYLQVPFWFCQNYGLAFPLISLQFNDLQFKLKVKKIIDCINVKIDPDVDIDINQDFLNKLDKIIKNELEISVLLEYVSLDGNERQKFIQSGHEYLITQVQEVVFNNVSPFNNNFNIEMFHCIKDLYWNVTEENNNILNSNDYDKYYEIVKLYTFSSTNIEYVNYLNIMYNPFILFDFNKFIYGLNKYIELITTETITNEEHTEDIENIVAINEIKIPYALNSSITLNSVQLISQDYRYYNYAQIYNYYNSYAQLGVNVYSFSLYPTKTQPSGSCNIGRIPKVTLNINFMKNNKNNYLVRVYGTNYNILRIIGGIAGLAYQY